MVDTKVSRYQLSDSTFVEIPMCKARAVVLRNNLITRSKYFIAHNVPIKTYDIIITPDNIRKPTKPENKKITEIGNEIDVLFKNGVTKENYHKRGKIVKNFPYHVR